MTAIQQIAQLLDGEWTTSITGREADVPKPLIETQKDDTKESLRTRDVAHVADAGNFDITPKGFGWTHQGTSSTVAVELRTANRREEGTKVDGRKRLYGDVDPDFSTDRWGGLVGETLRVIQSNRKGLANNDRLVAGPVLDQSDMEGQGYYRADVQVRLLTHAEHIDPSV